MRLSFEKIEVLVAEKEITLSEFYKEVHMSLSTVKRIKKGYDVRTKTAGKIAHYLGVSVRDILED